ncbi:MAG: hypothetical protein HRU19_04490 [Pseudobacteriovorax sp.]|nr:hypothetical protein [Pseudobacteriovorax sp.]
MSLIFHCLAAIFCFWACLWIIRLKGRLGFARQLLASLRQSPQSRVYVDYPKVCLKRLSEVIGATFQSESNPEPCQIKLKPWMELHLKFTILSFKLEQNGSLRVGLESYGNQEEPETSQLQDAIPSVAAIILEGN